MDFNCWSLQVGFNAVKINGFLMAAMQAVTTATGGQYFRARNPAELKTIYEYIDQLEPIPEEQTFRPQKSLFHLPLAISLALASLILVLRAVPITRRRLLA